MKSSQNRKSLPTNITLEPEVKSELTNRADALGISVSKLLSALVKVYCGMRVSPPEKPVETELKRIFGREQFLAFLRAVAEALPQDAEKIVKAGASENFTPDKWSYGKTGILAFFNPNQENVGAVFSSASELKSKHRFERVVVVAPLADIMPISARSDMEGGGIFVVSISRLKDFLTEKNPMKKAVVTRRKK